MRGPQFRDSQEKTKLRNLYIDQNFFGYINQIFADNFRTGQTNSKMIIQFDRSWNKECFCISKIIEG